MALLSIANRTNEIALSKDLIFTPSVPIHVTSQLDNLSIISILLLLSDDALSLIDEGKHVLNEEILDNSRVKSVVSCFWMTGEGLDRKSLSLF